MELSRGFVTYVTRGPRQSSRVQLTHTASRTWFSGGRTVRPPPRRGPRGRAGSTLGSTRRVAGTTSEDLRSGGYTDRGRGTYSSRPRPGYFAAFFLRSAQEAVIRSETAFFSSAVIGRRFLVGLASDAVSATGVAAAAGRREEERRSCINLLLRSNLVDLFLTSASGGPL